MLEVRNVSKFYRSGFWNNQKIEAVQDVSLTIHEGEIFGIVGESGCGKTTLAKIIAGLLVASSGQVLYKEREITSLKKKDWKELRRDIQIVFQHPQMTFNPRSTVYSACMEPVRNYHLAENKAEEEQLVRSALEQVGVLPDQLMKFPHEISGGQAQRVSIARTLILNPKLLICDEPTSMLDISVQAQIMALLKKINQSNRLAMLYISHNLDVIRAMCDRVAVMAKGRIVEMGTTEEVFTNPKDSYTRRLIASQML